MGSIGDLGEVVSATAGAGVGAGATGGTGFQLDLLAKVFTLWSSAMSGCKTIWSLVLDWTIVANLIAIRHSVEQSLGVTDCLFGS